MTSTNIDETGSSLPTEDSPSTNVSVSTAEQEPTIHLSIENDSSTNPPVSTMQREPVVETLIGNIFSTSVQASTIQQEEVLDLSLRNASSTSGQVSNVKDKPVLNPSIENTSPYTLFAPAEAHRASSNEIFLLELGLRSASNRERRPVLPGDHVPSSLSSTLFGSSSFNFSNLFPIDNQTTNFLENPMIHMLPCWSIYPLNQQQSRTTRPLESVYPIFRSSSFPSYQTSEQINIPSSSLETSTESISTHATMSSSLSTSIGNESVKQPTPSDITNINGPIDNDRANVSSLSKAHESSADSRDGNENSTSDNVDENVIIDDLHNEASMVKAIDEDRNIIESRRIHLEELNVETPRQRRSERLANKSRRFYSPDSYPEERRSNALSKKRRMR